MYFRGSPRGGFGDAEPLSLHATKVANAFEGGLVTTNDDELAEKSIRCRTSASRGADNVIHLGVNGKMHESSAAMGITSAWISSLNGTVQTRQHIVRDSGMFPVCTCWKGMRGSATTTTMWCSRWMRARRDRPGLAACCPACGKRSGAPIFFGLDATAWDPIGPCPDFWAAYTGHQEGAIRCFGASNGYGDRPG